jgi:putative transposase
LPDKDTAWVDAKLVEAFNHPDPDTGLRNAKSLPAQLDKTYPSAAASLREGLKEMFILARLGIDGRLAQDVDDVESDRVDDLDRPGPPTRR